MVYLAGDIGGTKTHLALYKEQSGTPVSIKEHKFPSKNYLDLSSIVKEFLKGENIKVERACFGIAGPVKQGKSKATNLPWLVDTEILSKELQIEKVGLINDLEANAYGLKALKDEEFYVLNAGVPDLEQNQAMISAGTGLGEAGIYFDGKEHHPFGSEGGHSDFGPRGILQEELFEYLSKKFEHVSYERILSGPGLYNVYQFLIDTGKETEKALILKEIKEGDSPRLISEFGVQGKSPACSRTLEIFSSVYGAEAGNVALKMLALGGIFIGGGIAPKILDVLKKGEFMKAFMSKGRFCDLLSAIPVKVVLNEKTALLGSMHYARSLL